MGSGYGAHCHLCGDTASAEPPSGLCAYWPGATSWVMCPSCLGRRLSPMEVGEFGTGTDFTYFLALEALTVGGWMTAKWGMGGWWWPAGGGGGWWLAQG